ncbi:MAG: DEAD/DEAH box helicase [Treponema sp.]|nr:DEAD/DEAH box helicase [Treponema sp.]MBQ2551371.1 DEAD/DEAH box helicase [Treponema sp.]MBQ4237279.1 DEAD/DEAH box helicase [Treponema sp.]
MAIDYKNLPVYAQKQRILEALEKNQVIVVQSPTGSGKTTQLPVILHEAGYSENGIIAVTQPRRIAALSVSEFISKQLGTKYPGLVGYKFRFEDKTDSTTKIKIMTDGILLQEMKLDPWMSKYSVIMVDEAHERSLNIDFVLGLLKRILSERKDFKVIVSSATMNAEAFSKYFDDCPIVTIETQVYPVTMIYDPPLVEASTSSENAVDALLSKIESIIDRVLDNRENGDILVFLPGEKIIKDAMLRLQTSSFRNKIHVIPLYGRLPKEEQEKVFSNPPFGKKKVVLSTNIAETSVTINGITTVIDSGLAKLNFYSPRTFTSSLIESRISKASCSQRRGRAGRTCPGTCYRLYPREDFETREEFTTEEIYRTDLSEVVLRMAELGITDFEKFNFISPPGHEGLVGAVNTLNMLKALESDGTLSKTGRLMVEFPLEPRVSRIIVESILYYPSVLEEVIIASSFLSAQSPFVLPVGEETDARQAHHSFRDIQGDFVSYINLFRKYMDAPNKEKFCKRSYLDEKVMAEILNVKLQLEDIVSSRLQMPITSGGSIDDYLCCIASGMIQFVCMREGRETYRTLTAEHITIHPGSSMFRMNPLYIVAGEIVKTSRMFAMSVSPLTKNLLDKIYPGLEGQLSSLSRKGGKNKKEEGEKSGKEKHVSENAIYFGGQKFEYEKVKGKKTIVLPLEKLKKAAAAEENLPHELENVHATVMVRGNNPLLINEKLSLIFSVVKNLNLEPLTEKQWARNMNLYIKDETCGKENLESLISNLGAIMRITTAKRSSKEFGFICLFTDGCGTYWFKVSRGFSTAQNESLSSLEKLIDDTKDAELGPAEKEKINMIYRMVNSLY